MGEVLAGGALAVLGGLLGSLLSGWLESRRFARQRDADAAASVDSAVVEVVSRRQA